MRSMSGLRIDIGIDAWMSLAQLISTSPRISQLTSFEDIAVPAATRNWNGHGNTSPLAVRVRALLPIRELVRHRRRRTAGSERHLRRRWRDRHLLILLLARGDQRFE